MEFPTWILSDEQRARAESLGYRHEIRYGNFMLTRPKDMHVIWPHIDGLISCFIRDGMYVKHKKFKDYDRALARRFGDRDVRSEDEMYD